VAVAVVDLGAWLVVTGAGSMRWDTYGGSGFSVRRHPVRASATKST
jgi:hypothetical protein